jgi:hypothetical protein
MASFTVASQHIIARDPKNPKQQAITAQPGMSKPLAIRLPSLPRKVKLDIKPQSLPPLDQGKKPTYNDYQPR